MSALRISGNLHTYHLLATHVGGLDKRLFVAVLVAQGDVAALKEYAELLDVLERSGSAKLGSRYGASPAQGGGG